MCSTSNCMRRANVLHVAENAFKDLAPENGSEGCFVETTLHSFIAYPLENAIFNKVTLPNCFSGCFLCIYSF